LSFIGGRSVLEALTLLAQGVPWSGLETRLTRQDLGHFVEVLLNFIGEHFAGDLGIM